MCLLKRGSFLKLRVNFKSDVNVNLAKAQVFGSLGGQLIPYSLDLPDTSIRCNDKTNTSQCSVKVGDNFFTLSVKILEFYPTIEVPIVWKMVDQTTKKTVACLTFNSKIVE
uniref:MD-2-related lipid-recognition domain-containing protein n=1 Tax=Romanomermis culicivorax TaxID=13658 RepID=A0A915LDK7_ROMCU